MVNKTKHPLYSRYENMIQRCYNPNNTGYKNYGGRGIKICDRWLGSNGFDNFVNDIGPIGKRKNTLDRINVDGNYEPSNCRWATWKVQALNKRRLNSRNTSSMTGVSWSKTRKAWHVYIWHEHMRLTFGYYDDIYRAAYIYNYHALLYRGKNAKLNPIPKHLLSELKKNVGY